MGTINWTKDQQQIIDMRGCNILVSAAAGSGNSPEVTGSFCRIP